MLGQPIRKLSPRQNWGKFRPYFASPGANLTKTFTSRIRLSQEAFAERAGMKYKHYQALEAGAEDGIPLLDVPEATWKIAA